MLGNENAPAMLYLLDTNTISQAFGSFNPGIFVSFWERFDVLVRDGGAASVRLVRLELERAPKSAVVQSILRLENLNHDFFSDPTERELLLVQEMSNDPALSAAANRWIIKGDRGTEDADPHLIARARASILPITVVTEESAADNRPGAIPAVCRHFNLDCINLDEMIFRLGWQF